MLKHIGLIHNNKCMCVPNYREREKERKKTGAERFEKQDVKKHKRLIGID